MRTGPLTSKHIFDNKYKFKGVWEADQKKYHDETMEKFAKQMEEAGIDPANIPPPSLEAGSLEETAEVMNEFIKELSELPGHQENLKNCDVKTVSLKG